MKISKNFTLEEFITSDSAIKYNIDNTPTKEVQQHIIDLVVNILQPLRDAYGKPIIINSGYRNPQLNSKVGGSKTSAHLTGYAADTRASNMKEYQDFLLKWIKGRQFDQIIIEYPKNGIASWLHIGYKNNQGKQRKQILTIK